MTTSLDYFLPNVSTQDTRKRVQAHSELVPYLSDPHSSLYCTEIDEFIGGLVAWVNCSNYKISLNGLEVLCLMVDRMGEDFRHHVTSVLPAVVDRLGDSKDQVRDQAQQLLLKLMMPATSPQYVFERMMSAFTHKLWHVREGVLVCLQNTINTYGSRSLQLSKMVPSICKLLDDQNSQVREQAIYTLTEIYRHVGERVRQDLAKKGIPPQRLNQIYAKFDELKNSGGMLPTADLLAIQCVPVLFMGTPRYWVQRSDTMTEDTPINGDLDSELWSSPLMHYTSPFDDYKELFDEIDSEGVFKFPDVHPPLPTRSSSSSTPRSPLSPLSDPFSPTRSGPFEDDTDFARPLSTKVPHARKSNSTTSSIPPARKSNFGAKPATASTGGGSSGGVDEDFFIKSFEDVPKVQIFSSRDVSDHMTKIQTILNDPNNDWEKRNDAMKSLRGVIVAGGMEHEDFHQNLRMMVSCFNLAVKDLRSQVVREACITLGYLSQQLGNKFDHLAETTLPLLINLIPNSAKIMASSGIVCIRFIIQYTHSSRLVPIITGNMTSKSNIIRRHCCEFLNQLLHNWSTHTLEKYIANIQDAIKKGISDADSEARAFSRKAFWGFAEHFRDQADALLNSLEPAKQKMLHGEMSGSSSNNSLNSAEGLRMKPSRPRSASQDRTTFDSSTLGRIGKKKHSSISSARSDTGAARQRSSTIQNVISPPDRSRSRSKPGSSQSQPGSRSGSPASRRSYLTHTTAGREPMTPRTQRRSGMARSQGNSRETSPSRHNMQPGRERRLSGGSSKLPMSASKSKKPLTSRMLRPGSDTEDYVADALQRGAPGRRRYDTYDSDDAASETSSVCSERSYSSVGRTSEDTSEIICLLGSGSYADRKEGLIALQHLLRSNRYLNRVELQKVTEVFTRMFHDPHSKVLSLFLDTLVDLVIVHNRDLVSQLYMLLTRLLNKTGTDMLGSVQNKVQKALDAIRENFPFDHQLSVLTKYIIDTTQSPNLKVKVAMLSYLHSLLLMMDPSDFMNSADTRLALSRIINWLAEPKSVDVRKGAQSVLIAMFNLNPSEFSLMLSALPKAFQESAAKVLNTHMRSASQGHTTEVLSPKNVNPQPLNRSRPPSRGHHDITETENMNPQDIYNSIKRTTEDIQSLSFHSKLDSYDDVKKKHEFTSQDSGIQDLRNDSPDGVETKRGNHYNPSQYHDEGSMNGFNRSRLADPEFEEGSLLFFFSDLNDNNLITNILEELSNHNRRNKERKDSMLSLMKMTREGMLDSWDEHFKAVLLILLETLGDDDGHIRALSLRVLREILRNQPNRFKDYAELTILRVLEAHKDTVRDVERSAEECADTLANYIPPEQSVRILSNIIATAQFPVNLAAIKMQNKVIELLPKDTLENQLQDIIPSLLRGYDDSESQVRKAAVFCLVAIHASVGDVIWNHLTKLNYSKVKLLNLYIKRNQQKRESTGATDT
ncbi:hypothetical protein FSP39_012814 [Pinctada imbricata]|uniref:TOG domain-containing protein n=1 Tax=Pinctada imbricata TaxID=66713 RepID=A0AA88YIC2_PINIB|nr:hypothetical protein FSP39_012814 [Pinctada imbricata]